MIALVCALFALLPAAETQAAPTSQPAATQPTAGGPAASQPATTYLGKPVSDQWVNSQYDHFKGVLFKVQGKEGKVFNLLETNHDCGGQLLDLTNPPAPGSTRRPGGHLCVVTKEMIATRGGVAWTTKVERGKKLVDETSGVAIKTGLLPGQVFKHPFIFNDGGGYKIANQFTKDDFVAYINGGSPLVSGFREISPDQAAKLAPSDYHVWDKNYFVPVVVPSPDIPAASK